ncbi:MULTISPECIES: ABC transporter substrate-binding protein [Inquilinus]|uniref:ABC-type glycerol-3-phosphate transport system substrate-binding protein n=1 Tax=Inquilinus ginsengisoli TaxID=363840 RepID=A0ABU1JNU4_9PROT|nr:sugar ABC transporter substrate-binding protein [Inquilinus ginsengisoli]MDR6289215.1 ABC-type glycerol-3-phosphate transport system substrate-binding protein [Inquilinus ginsengisoli]
MKTLTAILGLAVAAGAASLSVTPAQAEPVTLTWQMWASTDAEVAAWKHVAEMVTAKHPDIKVELRTAPWRDYWTKLPTFVASNQLADIVSIQSLRLPNFTTIFEPLAEYASKSGLDLGQFDRSIIEGMSADGQLYALPYDFGPFMLFYNQDLFEKYQVPLPKPGWTQAEFLAAAKALTRDGNYGFGATSVDYWLPFVLSDGANYLTADGELNFTDPALQQVFQSWVELVTKDKVAPVIAASGQPSNEIIGGRFASGNVAMYFDGPWSLINKRKSVTFHIGLAPVPAGKSGSVTLTAGSGFGIAKTSQHKQEAWEAIQILTGPEAEQYLASEGRAFAARTEQQKYWYDVAASGVAGAREAISFALQNAKPYRTTANWNTVAELLEQYVPLAFGGSQTGPQVLDTVQSLASE